MFDFLKKIFQKKDDVPKVQVTGFRDGLLSFRSDLAKVADNDKTLESLDIDLSKMARVQKVLRVSSRDLPAYMGLTEEIALSGIRLSTSEPLEVGQLLELTIEFDCHKIGTRKVKGRVEWSAHKGDGTCHSGLRFHDLDSVTFRKLAQYIQARRTAE